jgi:polyisoprenoid-binding protein YceI
MQETMESTQFPNVTFKGVSKLTPPTTFPATVKLDVKGELEFHGRKKPETVPVEVTFTSAKDAQATAKFAVSLEKYEVDRPSLMLIKIDDAIQIALDLVLKGQ